MFSELLNHPLVSLLDRFTRFRPRYANDNTPLSTLLSKIEFPNFNRDELFNISDLIRKGKDIQTVLRTVSQLFKYDQNFVEELLALNIVPSYVSTNNYLICAILKNIIGWLAEKNTLSLTPYFSSAIDIIFLVKRSVQQNEFDFMLYTVTATYSVCPNIEFPPELIPKIFSHASMDGFDSAVLLLLKLKRQNKIEEERFLQNFLMVSLSGSTGDLNNCNLLNICYYLESYISEFDDNSLDILRAIASDKDDESIRNLFIKIPTFIFLEIGKNGLEDFPKPLENKLTEFDTTLSTHNLNIEMNDLDSFPNGLIPPPANAFETTKKFEDFMKKENISLALKIINLLSYVLDCYNTVFFKAFAEHIISYSDVQFFLIFIYILTHSKYTESDKIVLEALTSSYVFMPGLTIFNPTDGIELLSFMRKTVINIFANMFPDGISNIFLSLCSHPFLFSEIVGRIQTKMESFNLLDLTDEITLSSIIEVINTLAAIQLKEKEIELTVQKARSTIIIFIFSLLDNQTVALRCFTSSVFSVGFLSHITETSMQGPMTHSLRRFFSRLDNQNIELLTPFCEFICGVIDMSRESSNCNDKLVLDLISSVNEASSHSVDLSSVFYPLANSATNYLIKRPSEEMLKETLQFFVQLSVNCNDLTLSLDDVMSLSKTIKQIEKEASDTTLTLLISIIAKSKSITTDAMFFIQEPNAVLLLFSIIKAKEVLVKYINILTTLCKYCFYNCQMCNKGCIDLLLLKIVENEDREFTFRSCTFQFDADEDLIKNYVFPLVKIICSGASSPQVPSNIISLMVPVNDVFPKYAIDAMDLVSSTISILSTDPKISYQAGIIDQYILYNSLMIADLAGGFSISFMLCIDIQASLTSNIRPLIFQLTDNVSITFQIFIRGESILARTIQDDTTSIATLCPSFPGSSWHKCTIDVSFYEDNIGALSFSLDDSTENYTSLSFPNFVRNELLLQLGGIAELTEEHGLKNFVCSVSSFKFYGCSGIQENPQENASSSSTTTTTNDVLKLILAQNQTKLSEKARRINKSYFAYNLFDAFKEGQNTKLLIPLFLFVDKMPPHFASQLIDTLTFIVTSSTKVEDQFDSVPLIYRYLSQCPSLSYQIFNKLVSFFSNCKTDRLINEFLEYVIFNIDLWVRTDAASLQKISQYWSTLTTYDTIKIKDIIPKLRVYFWYEPIEVELIFKGRDPNVDIELVRYNFDKLLVNLSFTKHDFLVIASHCSTCVDQKQVSDLLSILCELVIKNPGVVPSNYCRYLFHIFKPKQNRRFIHLLRLICLLSDTKLIQNLMIVIFFIGEQYIDKSLFNDVMELQKSFPELYIISIWMAQNLDEDCRERVALSLRDIDVQRISTMRFWYIPIILLTLCSGNETQALVNVFYGKAIRENENLFYEIELATRVLCYAGNYDEDVFIKPILFIYSMSDIRRSVQILLYHILFHFNEETHSKFLDTNVFDFNIDKSTKKEPNRKLITIKNIKDFLLENEFAKSSVRIRINNDMLLKDLDIITMVVEHKNDVPENPWINYLAFLVMQTYGETFDSIKKQILSEYSIFTDTIYSAAMRSMNDMKDNLISFFSFDYENHLKMQYLITIASEGIAEVNDKTNLVFTKEMEDSFISNYANEASIWSILNKRVKIMRNGFVIDKVLHMPLLKPSVVHCFYGNPYFEQNSETEKTLYESECTMIDIDYSQKVYFRIFKSIAIIHKAGKVIKIPLTKDVICLPRQRFQLNNSIEIFAQNKSYLLDFSPNTNVKAFHELERTTKTKIDIKVLKDMWCTGKLSNFDYILYLNALSGRSFHDTLIYPIFPWLSFADGDERDLSKPVAGDKASIIDRSPLSPKNVHMYLGRIHPFDSAKCFSSFKEASDSARNIVSHSEITPEFFSCPEYFKGFVENPFDFVLSNRRKLESNEVSKSLHNWIDITFGCLTNPASILRENVWDNCTAKKEAIIKAMSTCGQIPATLFTIKHPQKSNFFRHCYDEKRLRMPMKFSTAVFCGFTDCVASFYVEADNNLFYITASYQTGEITTTSLSNKVKIDKGIRIASHGTKYALLDSNKCNVIIGSSNEQMNINFKNPSLFSSNGNLFAIANKEGLIKVNDKTIVSTTDDLICICVSSVFNIVVVGTVEKCLVSYDANGKFLFLVHIESKPISVKITEGMGIIAVLCKSEIYTFTINGTLISKFNVEPNYVKNIVCLKSIDLIDRVFTVDDKGCFREMPLGENNKELGPVIYKCYGQLSCIGAGDADNAIVALKNDGTIFFIPYK